MHFFVNSTRIFHESSHPAIGQFYSTFNF
jgi:hypothetical protein